MTNRLTSTFENKCSEFGISVFGMPAVGKTTLVSMCAGARFTNQYKPTVERDVSTKLSINGEIFRLAISDTMGAAEETDMIKDNCLYQKDGFILVYSIDSQKSFDLVKKLAEELMDKINFDVQALPIVLIGNKADLESHREVSFSEGEELKESYNLTHHFETSAKTINKGIPLAFIELTKAMIDANPSRSNKMNMNSVNLDDNSSMNIHNQNQQNHAFNNTPNANELRIPDSDYMNNGNVSNNLNGASGSGSSGNNFVGSTENSNINMGGQHSITSMHGESNLVTNNSSQTYNTQLQNNRGFNDNCENIDGNKGDDFRECRIQ